MSILNNSNVKTSTNGVKYIIFPLFEKAGVTHGFSTRIGGVSTGIYSTMNLSFHRGDSYENVLMNHKLFSEAVGYDYTRTVFSDQIHETNIAHVTEADIGRGMDGNGGITGMDGLITDVPGIPLMTFYADCVPLFFYDPVKKVVATAHSGWRGTVAGMGRKMVETLVSDYGCKRENIIAAIGPSICMDCYEVSDDVACEFEKAFPVAPYDKLIFNKGNGKYNLNLWFANEFWLTDSGILKDNIDMPAPFS